MKDKRQAEFEHGVEIAPAWKMKRLICLGAMASVAAWLLIGNMDVLACGGWGSGVTTSGTSLPSPSSASDSGYNWAWSYEMDGANGSFTGNASATHDLWGDNNDQDTGVKEASGWEQGKIGDWSSGGTGHHVAPGNAIVTGQGDGTVYGTIHMDANNASLTSGSCAALAYGNVTFTGVASGSVEINLNGTYKESDTEISGTLSSSPSVTIETTCGADIADATGINTISLTQQFTGNIAGQLQKGHGVCSVRARANAGAYESSVNASTSITTGVGKNYGGSGACGSICELHDNH